MFSLGQKSTLERFQLWLVKAFRLFWAKMKISIKDSLQALLKPNSSQIEDFSRILSVGQTIYYMTGSNKRFLMFYHSFLNSCYHTLHKK